MFLKLSPIIHPNVKQTPPVTPCVGTETGLYNSPGKRKELRKKVLRVHNERKYCTESIKI